MLEIKSPNPLDIPRGQPSLFLAGGISNCPDWQSEAVDRLIRHRRWVLLNPRRSDFDSSNQVVEEEQITWEFHALRAADATLFWFPRETVCPITLFEYGTWLTVDRPLFVGAHPEYCRRRDLVIQTRLSRQFNGGWGIEIHNSLDDVLTHFERTMGL